MSDTASIMPEHPPVLDWIHDFDHTDPRWTENPYPIWEELRSASPVVHTDRFLGCYMPTTYEAVKEIAYDTALMTAVHEMTAYFDDQIEQRKQHPSDDLISTLMKATDRNGQPLSDQHVLGSLRLILIAGIDTTWSAIGSSLWHLARTPADRARLVAEPDLMPTAVEELLRAYSPVTMAREVVKETTISGCPVKAGNMVLLSFPAANRDPAVFPDADKVVIDRKENRHAAFGLGIHRCIGSNLARMEMMVAIEEWLKRIPDFRLDPAGRVTWSEGTVRGPRQLPLLFRPKS